MSWECIVLVSGKDGGNGLFSILWESDSERRADIGYV